MADVKVGGIVQELRADAKGFLGPLADAEAAVARFGAVAEAEFGRAMEAYDAVAAEAARITESVRTPTERYAATVAGLTGHLRAGRISQETYSRAVREAYTTTDEYAQSVRESAAATAAETAARDRAAAITREAETAEERYAATVAELTGHLRAGRISQETFNRATQAAAQTLPEARAAADAHNRATDEARRLYEATRTPAERYAARVRELSDLYRRGYVDAATYRRGLAGLRDELPRLADGFRRVGASASSAGASMSAMGRNASMYVTAPIVGLGALAVREFATFDDAMTQALSITSGVTAELRGEMEALALELSGRSRKAPTEIAGAYYELLSAGMDARSAMGALTPVLNLATAGNMDLGRAVAYSTAALSAMGLRTGDAAADAASLVRITDALAEAANMSQGSVEQFAEALANKTAGNMRTAGRTLEEGLAVLAVYAEQGRKGAEGAEQFAIAFREFQQAMIKEPEAWARYGMSVYDASGAMKSTADIVAMLEERFAGLSDEAKSALFNELGFFSESQNAIKMLLGQSSRIREFQSRLEGAAGAAGKVAAVQMTSFAAQWDRLLNSFRAAGIEIGRLLAPSLLWVNGLLTQSLELWRGLSDETKLIAVGVAGVIASVGPAMVVFGGLAAAAGAVVTGLGTLVTFAGPIAVVAGAVAAVAAAMVAVGVAVAAAAYALVGADGLAAAWEAGVAGAKQAAEAAIGFFVNFRENWEKLTEWFKEHWREVLADLANGYATYVDNMTHNAGVGFAAMLRMQTVWAGFALKNYALFFYRDLPKLVSDGLSKLLAFTGELASGVRGFLWEILTGGGPEAVAKAVEGITNAARGPLARFAADLGAGAEADSIREAFGKMMGAAAGEANRLRSPFAGFRSSITKLPDFALEWGKKTSEAFATGVAAPAAAAGAKGAAVDLVRPLGVEVDKLIGEWGKSASQLGMSERERAIADLAVRGATGPDVTRLREADAAFKRAEEAQTLMEDAKALTASMKTPQQRYNEELEKFGKMIDAGLIDLETHGRAVAEARRDLEREIVVKWRSEGAEAVLADSAAAAAAIAAHRDRLAGRHTTTADLIADRGGAFAARDVTVGAVETTPPPVAGLTPSSTTPRVPRAYSGTASGKRSEELLERTATATESLNATMQAVAGLSHQDRFL